MNSTTKEYEIGDCEWKFINNMKMVIVTEIYKEYEKSDCDWKSIKNMKIVIVTENS